MWGDLDLLFTIPELRWQLIGVGIIGGVGAFLSVYVVMRRIVFISAAVAELSAAGLALSELLKIHRLTGALVVGLVGILVLARAQERSRIPRDALIGFVYIAAGGFALLLLHWSDAMNIHVLQELQGTVLAASPGEVMRLAALFAVLLAVQTVLFKDFLFVAFDPDSARSLGYPVGLLNAVWFLTLGVFIGFTMYAAGVLVTFAVLVLPATAALALTSSLRGAFAVAIGMATILSVGGYLVSFVFDLPVGSTIVAMLVGGVLLAYLYRQVADFFQAKQASGVPVGKSG